MRVKIECPINFLQVQNLNIILEDLGYTIDSKDPECIIVNPGTDVFLGEDYFSRYKNLKAVGTPSTGVNHLDMEYLNSRNIVVKCLLDNRDVLENIHASAEFTWLHVMNAFRRFIPATNSTDNWRMPETRGLISKGSLDNFKENLIVINTSRGETVNEDYIYDLITRDKIFYSCDVLCNEQNIKKLKQSKLFNLKRDNIVITPHVAGATVESQTKALRGILELCIR